MSDVFVARDLRAYFREWLSGNYYRADLFEMVMMVLTSERAVTFVDISHPRLGADYGTVDLKFDMTDSNVVRVYIRDVSNTQLLAQIKKGRIRSVEDYARKISWALMVDYF